MNPTKEELDEAIAKLQEIAEITVRRGNKPKIVITALTILTRYRDGELVEVTKGEVDEHLESATPEMLIKIIKAQGANINYWRREFYKATNTWNCSECGTPLISKKNASEPVGELKCHDCWKKDGELVEKSDQKDLLLNFLRWYDKLTPSQKCTVHPPAGSGGTFGLYNKAEGSIIDDFLRTTPPTNQTEKP